MFSERQQADDLFQEMLIRLWKGFDSFEGRSSEKTFFIWLLLRLFDLLFWYIDCKQRTKSYDELNMEIDELLKEE